jgi:hypothetical protein
MNPYAKPIGGIIAMSSQRTKRASVTRQAIWNPMSTNAIECHDRVESTDFLDDDGSGSDLVRLITIYDVARLLFATPRSGPGSKLQ